MIPEGRWIRHLVVAPLPDRHPWIVLCPYAGASRSAFATLGSDVALPGLTLSLAVYPGHDHRMGEPPRTAIAALADALAEELSALPAQWRSRLILAGHSMGAQVAFETALRLQARNRGPAGLVLSGCQAPHLRGRRLLSGLDDGHFMDELIAIGGSDARLREKPELFSVFLPMLRADFLATESYLRPLQDAVMGARAGVPTLLIHGSYDAEASPEEVLAWGPWIAPDFVSVRITGDHFYVTQRIHAFTAVILNFYRQRIAG